ncbi:MAG TPA: TadE/TadG family type IV pilus assembly protein [Nocardioidaceae bacterium]|nr:TadE/TadG family type IV pilus assembly protein [Nocardioidaceae bacterium]
MVTLLRRARTRARPGREHGAAALEFGLVAPILFAVVFGIISYGLWFDDSLNLRQGVREAARQAVVGNFGGTTTCDATYSSTLPAGSTDMQELVCQVKEDVAAISGPTYVKVVPPAGGWHIGDQLLVCAMVKANAVPGLVPLPDDRLIRTRTQMSIEMADPGQVEPGLEEVPPAGADWTWCTA